MKIPDLIPRRGEGEEAEGVVEGVLYQLVTGAVVQFRQFLISVLTTTTTITTTIMQQPGVS